jgi:hypothetical protein
MTARLSLCPSSASTATSLETGPRQPVHILGQDPVGVCPLSLRKSQRCVYFAKSFSRRLFVINSCDERNSP